MRRRRDITFTLALCLSLAIHALIVEAAIRQYAKFTPVPAAPAPRGVDLVLVTEKTRPPDERLGESDGRLDTDALLSTPGETDMAARPSDQTQADLSLDPQGNNGSEAVQMTQAPPASPPVFQSPPSQIEQAVRIPKDDTGVKEPPVIGLEGQFRAGDEVAPQPGAQSEAEEEQSPPQQVAVAPPQVVATPRQPTQQNLPPAAPSLPGDPSPQGESESDAFSTKPSVDFVGGRTIARLGRKHKIIRPKLEMAGYADLLSLRPPVVIELRLHLTAEGYVEKVEIVKPGGSINIDQPTRIAAYKWWFEPKKDASGRNVPEVIPFTVRFL
jgi:hypothetical protein